MILKHGTLVLIDSFPQPNANTHSFILLYFFVSQHSKTSLKSLDLAVDCRDSEAELCVPKPALELWGQVNPALCGANLPQPSQLWWSCCLQTDVSLQTHWSAQADLHILPALPEEQEQLYANLTVRVLSQCCPVFLSCLRGSVLPLWMATGDGAAHSKNASQIILQIIKHWVFSFN